MHTTNRNLKTDERGSILMETVLSLPLLILLIGGSMWLGELHINRFELSQVEREAAFGPRRNLPPPENASVNTKNTGDFYLTTTAVGERTVGMPEWTQGLFGVFEVLYGDDEMPRDVTVNGREQQRGFTAITRAVEVEEPRTAPGSDLAKGDWQDLNNEPWIDEATAPPEVYDAPTLQQYSRDPGYKLLSL